MDVGYVCSVCLSSKSPFHLLTPLAAKTNMLPVFCNPNLPDNLCLTCGSYLSLSAAQTVQPALIPRKRKKKKRVGATGSATPGGSTPVGGGTPMHA